MKKIATAILLSTLASAAAAKDKPLPLSDAIAAGLSGKTVAVVRHPRPDFTAMTAGKAMFGLIGAATMVSAGNDLIAGNNVEDPAAILERELAPALARKYGFQLKDAPAYAVSQKKAAQIAALEPGVDYVLDLRSGGWMFAYYPTDWNSYWMMYSVQVQLIDVATAKPVANLACNIGNKGDKHPPSHEDLIANGAQLIKDTTQGFGWTCMKLLAKEEFHLADTDTAAVPEQFVDVFGKFAVAHHGAAPTPAAATPGTTPAPASDAAPVAPAATSTDAPVADAPVAASTDAPVAEAPAAATAEAPAVQAPAADAPAEAPAQAPAAEADTAQGAAPAAN
jgi:hypothetical protein